MISCFFFTGSSISNTPDHQKRKSEDDDESSDPYAFHGYSKKEKEALEKFTISPKKEALAAKKAEEKEKAKAKAKPTAAPKRGRKK